MHTNRDAEHEALLALVARVERAARDRDHEQVIAATHQILTTLAMHLDDEWTDRRLVDEAVRELRARSEQDIVEAFTNLVHAATVCSGAACSCEGLARQASSLLRRQIEVEARV